MKKATSGIRKAQPRIRDVRRNSMVMAVHPAIREVMEEIAHKEKRSLSWVAAEFVGLFAGIDAATGDKQPRLRRKKR